MKYFLSYKFTGADKDKLKEMLELVTSVLEDKGNTSFSFFRDIQKWGSTQTDRNEIIPMVLNELQNTDALLVILDASTKSTGMGIEVGYAVAINKPVFVLKRTEVTDDYIESVAKIIEQYESEKDIPQSLKNLIEKSSQHRS